MTGFLWSLPLAQVMGNGVRLKLDPHWLLNDVIHFCIKEKGCDDETSIETG
jgi:hypothetical protein